MTESLTATPLAPGDTADERARVKRALAWTHTARFLTTASRLTELPVSELPEIAFVGRSNAGKSTAINMLAQQRRLAFSSKTPGRTQHINLFDVGPKDAPNAIFVDLPGYGYAAVERSAKLRWQAVMADYLAERRSLAGIVLLVDSRHGFTELDGKLLDFVETRVRNGSVKLLTLLTKVDKLARADAVRAMARARTDLERAKTAEADVSLLAFSALRRSGVDEAAALLLRWVEGVGAPGGIEPIAA